MGLEAQVFQSRGVCLKVQYVTSLSYPQLQFHISRGQTWCAAHTPGES